MTPNQPPEPDNTNDADKGKLPPRSGDWHSGLKRDEPSVYKATTPRETVSEFVATPRTGDEWQVPEMPADATGVTVQPRPSALGFFNRRTRLADWLLALILAVLAFGSVVLTYQGIGHTWDEALYLKPSERAAAWMMGAFNSGDDSMLQNDAILRHWGRSLSGQDPLHPEVAPVPKLLDGAGLTYLQDLGLEPMEAMRWPAAILFGLTVGLIYLLGTREYGRIGGFAAALMYGMMPRVFGHAHIAASETPLAFFVVLLAWCFLVALRYWPMALFTGVALGLALATKFSALMLPLPFFLWGQIYRRRDYASNAFAMVLIAPLACLAVWPWLWYDGLDRFFSYVKFYLEHQRTAVFYMGRTWGYTSGPVAPFWYPLHITGIVVPVWILFFLALGLLRALISTIRRPVTILFVMLAFSWIGLAMLPHAPRYDGERLFFPAFAFLALIAGGGFSLVFDGVRRWRERRSGFGREANYLAAIALGACGVYGAGDIYFTHPNELNYYNWLVGRARGAYDKGFETAYWGEGVNEDVVGYLNSVLKPGDKVKTLALNDLAFDNLREWGKLPKNVDFSPDEPPFDYVVMQVRQGFMGPVERSLLKSKKPLRAFSAQGVPMIMIYKGSDVAQFFPAPSSESEQTTGTAPARMEMPVEASATSATAELQTTASAALGTTTSASLPSLLTSQTQTAAVDEITSGLRPAGNLSTATVTVLDLPTSNSETTATEDRLSTMAVELLQSPRDTPTSAPRIYEGDLPTTESLPADESVNP